jgi:hypothetical protein
MRTIPKSSDEESENYKICFHRPNGKADGYFMGVHRVQVNAILSKLPKHWTAIAYGNDGMPAFSFTN